MVFPADILARLAEAQPLQATMTGLLLHRLPVDWAGEGFREGEAGVPADPVFSYRQNDLTFQFAAATQQYPAGISYRYRLSGYDTGWQPATRERAANYSNLPPGAYTFEVQAADVNGRWSGSCRYPFTIRPPWWATWWAWGLWLALAAGAILFLLRLRIRAVRRQARVERLLVEQQLKALRAQINPHFLQNIFGFLIETTDRQSPERSRQILGQLSSYMRNALYRTDDNIVTLEDELLFAEEYLAINQLLFTDRFHYSIRVDDDVETVGTRLPSMLLQPLLENAVKHGVRHTGGAAAIIRIHVSVAGRYVRLVVANTIADDARRPPMPAGYRPKGLDITGQRLALLYRSAAAPARINAAAQGGEYEVTIEVPQPGAA